MWGRRRSTLWPITSIVKIPCFHCIFKELSHFSRIRNYPRIFLSPETTAETTDMTFFTYFRAVNKRNDFPTATKTLTRSLQGVSSRSYGVIVGVSLHGSLDDHSTCTLFFHDVHTALLTRRLDATMVPKNALSLCTNPTTPGRLNNGLWTLLQSFDTCAPGLGGGGDGGSMKCVMSIGVLCDQAFII